MITLEAGKVSVTDLGSTNGTYAEGVQVQANDKVELCDADELKFGSAVLTLKLPETEVAEPAEEAPAEAEPAEEEAPAEAQPTAEEAPVEEFELEEEAEAEPEPPAAPVARLTGASGEFDIMPGENTIGRRSENKIVLTDSYVSGSHAEIAADDDGFWLTDMGSTNGTVLDGIKLEPNDRTALNDGDEIVFGQTTLTFQVEHGTAD